jgi:hypothetical protein
MQIKATYPTQAHADAAETIAAFWADSYPIEAVLLVNSCARGKATADSCLDMNVLARPEVLRTELIAWESAWEDFNHTNPLIQKLKTAGRYSVVHLDFTAGVFETTEQDEAAGPDDFELGIGNLLAYSVVLRQKGDYLDQLKVQWLPFYSEALRQQRLPQVRFFCLNNLHHIPLFIERGLYFQAFDRLYNAYQEFLQALFISRRTYPIAYNKWIQEQMEELLHLPELYEQIVSLFEIRNFESEEILDKAQQVEHLLDEYAPAEGML